MEVEKYDDNGISRNFARVCSTLTCDYSFPDSKMTYDFKIFHNLVFRGRDSACLCCFSAGDTVFHAVDGCVFGSKCCLFYRRMFPDSDCIVTDINRIRAIRADSDVGADTGDFRGACAEA